ncbi:AAA family ATPase, partial [Pseudomonas syringae]
GHIPLEINLKDKSVDIPLSAWGTGTQNRTQVMMLILYANKIKEDMGGVNRITPIVIIEEPESFLHPSAQAEFGRIIRNLSRDLQIQIVTSTHSPYMLCQEHPESNILLDRKLYRKSLRQTEIVPVSEENWMSPFSNILGLANDSFSSWHAVIEAKKDCAIFVEGIIDKQYIEFIASLGVTGFSLPTGCEILPYEGKDALRNSILLKFVLEKFHKYLLTFDLDALNELDRPMRTLGLERDKHYHPIGISEPGKDCIEGLLPGEIPASVYSSNYSLVMKAQSQDPKDRKSAKNSLKALMLDAFKKRSDWTKNDLAGFKPLFSNITQAFKE